MTTRLCELIRLPPADLPSVAVPGPAFLALRMAAELMRQKTQRAACPTASPAGRILLLQRRITPASSCRLQWLRSLWCPAWARTTCTAARQPQVRAITLPFRCWRKHHVMMNNRASFECNNCAASCQLGSGLHPVVTSTSAETLRTTRADALFQTLVYPRLQVAPWLCKRPAAFRGTHRRSSSGSTTISCSSRTLSRPGCRLTARRRRRF